MSENEKPRLTIAILSFSDALFNNKVPWHKKGGWNNHNEEIDTLIVGNLGAESVVYILCDRASTPCHIFYVQTKLNYQKMGFAASLLEYFLKSFAQGVDVEASSPTSSSAKKLLERFGFAPLGNLMWWVKKKS